MGEAERKKVGRGETVTSPVGSDVGAAVGGLSTVGNAGISSLGLGDGSSVVPVGTEEGATVGGITTLGVAGSSSLGLGDGSSVVTVPVGPAVGDPVEEPVGDPVGLTVGVPVAGGRPILGAFVGVAVGTGVGGKLLSPSCKKRAQYSISSSRYLRASDRFHSLYVRISFLESLGCKSLFTSTIMRFSSIWEAGTP